MKTCGKVILVGEHAVVYGEMALATQIGLGVQARIVEGKHETDPIICKAIEVAGGGDELGVEIEGELPVGSGLGSSAAVAAAVIMAVRVHKGGPLPGNDKLFELVMECEKVAHGNPSGIDAAVVVYGGLVAFIKGQPVEKLMMKVPLKIVLVDTGKPEETTKEMVAKVAKSERKGKIITEIGQISREVKTNLLMGKQINDLLNLNGILLEELGVVGERAKNLSSELRKLGAAVKITGAGGVRSGSGIMIVINNDLVKTKQFLDNKQIKYLETTVGEQQ